MPVPCPRLATSSYFWDSGLQADPQIVQKNFWNNGAPTSSAHQEKQPLVHWDQVPVIPALISAVHRFVDVSASLVVFCLKETVNKSDEPPVKPSTPCPILISFNVLPSVHPWPAPVPPVGTDLPPFYTASNYTGMFSQLSVEIIRVDMIGCYACIGVFVLITVIFLRAACIAV